MTQLSYGHPVMLKFTNGVRWFVCAEDEEAQQIVSVFALAMQLGPGEGTGNILRVAVDSENPKPFSRVFLNVIDGYKHVKCVLHRPISSSDLIAALREISSIIARDAVDRGGILLHGALASFTAGESEYRSEKEFGVVLAGPSGIGKSTVSAKLEKPWRSQSDDSTLVVPDFQLTYWAHPWPTWSRLGESRNPDCNPESWNFQAAVPIRQFSFFLRPLMTVFPNYSP